ncbi:MAG: ABC transporter substrate-binding protein [Pseudomonadota bacterium]
MTIIPLLLFAVCVFLKTGAYANEAPQRIVSMNVCTDQLVMMLAERDRIASVSYLATNPSVSSMVHEAAGLHQNHGLAEEIFLLDPDLVIAGTFTTRPTVALLQRLGRPVLDVPPANSVEDIIANIRLIAGAIGAEEKGEALIADFEDGLAALDGGPGDGMPAVAYWSNGFTSGGGTLAADIMTRAGLTNLAAERGLTGTGQMPLEALVSSDPRLLVLGPRYEGDALAHQILDHPALQAWATSRHVVTIEDAAWVCGTPLVLKAVAGLVQARRSLAP